LPSKAGARVLQNFLQISYLVLFGRKKKGETPTGILAHAAKASGHTSVHDLLAKGEDIVVAAQALSSLPAKAKKVN
jgi:hypothetical protein